MATTIGTEYDHIDITNGVGTIRHPFKDASARENLVKVQDSQPQSSDNVVWIKETPESEVQVPTYAEFEEVAGDVSDLNSALNVQTYGRTIIKDETVTTMTAHIMNLDTPIPSGVPTVFKNTATNTVMSLGYLDEDGNETRLSVGLIAGESYSYVTTFPVYGIRNFTNGTEWKFMLLCGENLDGRLDTLEPKVSTLETETSSLNESVFKIEKGTTKINNVGTTDDVVEVSDLVSGYMNKTNGAFAGSGDGGYHTQKLKIEDYPVVFLSASKQYATGLCCLYNSEGTYVATVDDTSTTELVTVSDYKIDFTKLRETYPTAYYFACGTYPSSDGFELYTKASEDLEEYIDEKVSEKNNGIVYAAIGDSRTEKLSYVTVAYPDVVKKIKGYKTMYNWGIGGSTYVKISERTSAYEIVSAHSFSDVDVVSMCWGFNDYGRSLPIGTPGDTDDTTMCGAIYKVLNKIYTDNPNCTVFVFTPLPNKNVINSASDQAAFKQYTDAIIATCNKYNIPVYDSYADGGLPILLKDTFFDYDATHATNYTVWGTWIASHLP